MHAIEEVGPTKNKTVESKRNTHIQTCICAHTHTHALVQTHTFYVNRRKKVLPALDRSVKLV